MSNPAQRPYRRLTLSVTDKKIAGVCGGIAE
ncbi:MAG TPA: PspC domain-containing protein [Nakamurella sp.]